MRKVRWKREWMNWMYLGGFVHLNGNREVRVENCRRVLECDEVRVRIATRELIVDIWGTGLRVFDYNDNNVLVRGKIASVQLSDRRG
ncbi:MAG: YabP/YqfC family sporulation protein [Oscillospiraceae bacterium]|nr:YabP/YqfC family sporulation protein [Oscillospiraceae bacterium]